MSQISTRKIGITPTRKTPFLPRLGFCVDIAGYQLTYKQAPLTETLLNLRDMGFSSVNLIKLAQAQFGEITLTNDEKRTLPKRRKRS